MAEDQGPGLELASQVLKRFNASQEAKAKHPWYQRRPPQFGKRCHQWALREHWTLDEAANLLTYCDPERPTGLNGHAALDASVRETRTMIERSQLKRVGKKDNLVVARDLMKWVQSKNLDVPIELAEAMQSGPGIPAKPSNLEIDRHRCEAVALTLWHIDPNMSIAKIIEHKALRIIGGGAKYSPKTLRNWISEVDPRPPEKKRGRPKNTSK